MYKFLRAAAVASCLALASCTGTSLESVAVRSTAHVVKGFPYFLPKALVHISVSYSAKKELKIDASSLQYLPDPNAQFVVRFKPSAFADDDFSVSTNAKGLLTAVNTTNEDKSVEITKKLISIVTEVAKIRVAKSDGRSMDQPRKPFSLELLFDPFNKTDLRRVQRKLRSVGMSLKVEGLSRLRRSKHVITRSHTHWHHAKKCNSSICFRPLTPVRIIIADRTWGAGASHSQAEFLALLPNQHVLAGFDITRGACIKKLTELTLTNGILTKVHLNKPSEVLNCLDIPLEIAKAIVAIPGELLTFKVQNLQADNSLIAAQTQLLTAQSQLLAAQAKAAEEQKN